MIDDDGSSFSGIREANPTPKSWLGAISCLTFVCMKVEGNSPSFGNADMPCRCLCLGFAEQITNICPRRLTILQNWHNRFTDDRTFMVTKGGGWWMLWSGGGISGPASIEGAAVASIHESRRQEQRGSCGDVDHGDLGSRRLSVTLLIIMAFKNKIKRVGLLAVWHYSITPLVLYNFALLKNSQAKKKYMTACNVCRKPLVIHCISRTLFFIKFHNSLSTSSHRRSWTIIWFW